MSSPTAAALPSIDLDPRIFAAIDANAWERLYDLTEDFTVVSPTSAATLEPLLPLIERLKTEDFFGALAVLTGAPLPESALRDKLAVFLGRRLDEKHGLQALVAYSAGRDVKGHERMPALLRQQGIPEEEWPNRRADAIASYWADATTADSSNAAAWEALALALETRDPARAGEAAERATELAGHREHAWKLLSRLRRNAGQTNEADAILSRAGERGYAWAWFELAKIYSETNFEKALQFADAALQPNPENLEVLQLRRTMLRKLERWSELAQHLDDMCRCTADMALLAELHDELSRVYAGHLAEPIEGAELGKRAQWFRTPHEVLDWYWKMLEESPDDTDVWDEVDNFLRANLFWSDVGRLLMMRLERAESSDRLRYVDELRIVWQLVPGRGDAAWADVLNVEIDRAAADPSTKAAMETRRASVPIVDPPAPSEMPRNLMIAGGILVFFVVIIIAVTLAPFFI